MLKLWQLVPERLEMEIPSPGAEEMHARAFSPDGKYLVVTREQEESRGTDLELFALDVRERLAVWEANYYNYNDIRFSPDGRLVAVAHGGGLDVWDAMNGKRVHRRLNEYGLSRSSTDWCVIFSPDGKRVFYVDSFDNNLYGFDFQTSSKLGPWEGHKDEVRSLAISPDGQVLASGSDSRTIRLWESTSGHELARWNAHEGAVTALVFSVDGKTLFSGSDDGTLKLWNLPLIRKELSALGLNW